MVVAYTSCFRAAANIIPFSIQIIISPFIISKDGQRINIVAYHPAPLHGSVTNENCLFFNPMYIRLQAWARNPSSVTDFLTHRRTENDNQVRTPRIFTKVYGWWWWNWWRGWKVHCSLSHFNFLYANLNGSHYIERYFDYISQWSLSK